MKILSVDVGKENDYTAIGLFEMLTQRIKDVPIAPQVKKEISVYNLREHEKKNKGEIEIIWGCRHLERLPLGTPYPKQVERIVQLMSVPTVGPGTILLVDQTGVGNAVIDFLREANLSPIGILIHSGYNINVTENGYSVPKRELVTSLQVLTQTRRLILSKQLPLAQVLIREMDNFKMKITDSGNEQFAAWRDNENDDLVLMTAQMAWFAQRVLGSVINTERSRAEYDVS